MVRKALRPAANAIVDNEVASGLRRPPDIARVTMDEIAELRASGDLRTLDFVTSTSPHVWSPMRRAIRPVKGE